MNKFGLNSFKVIAPKKRRGVSEVISTLLLVVITVVGAVILTGFIDDSFVSGSLSVSSSTDTQLKTVKLRGYDTRDGLGLMGYSIDNKHVAGNMDLCRKTCVGNDNKIPADDGSEFIVIQIENQSIKPIVLKNLYLDNVNHPWDPATANKDLDATVTHLTGGFYPSDGRFSILSDDITDPTQHSNQVAGGETVNLLIKLHDDTYDDLALSKKIRVQLNIGENSLSEFFIESGDAI